MTKRHRRHTKAQTRWKLVSEEMLTFNEVKPTSVTANSNVSQKANGGMPIPQNKAMVRDQMNMRLKGLVPVQKSRQPSWLATPEARRKQVEAIKLRAKNRKVAREASKRYMETHGLKCISARIPTHIVDEFQCICEVHSLCKAEVIARLLNGFIQRNSYPHTK